MTERIEVANGARKSIFLNLRTILKLEIFVHEGGKLRLGILADDCPSLRVLTEAEKGAAIEVNWIILGKNKIENDSQFRLFEGAKLDFRCATYLCGNSELNFHYKAQHLGARSESSFDLRGSLTDEARKNSTLEIVFERGARDAVGLEHEHIALLSDAARSFCAPIIRCKEASVRGEHGASCGQIEPKKLQYLHARGFSLPQIRQMLTRAELLDVAQRMRRKEALKYIQERFDA